MGAGWPQGCSAGAGRVPGGLLGASCAQIPELMSSSQESVRAEHSWGVKPGSSANPDCRDQRVGTPPPGPGQSGPRMLEAGGSALNA